MIHVDAVNLLPAAKANPSKRGVAVSSNGNRRHG